MKTTESKPDKNGNRGNDPEINISYYYLGFAGKVKHLKQGWPTFLVKGQNYLKNDFKGHFSPQKLKLINLNIYCFVLKYSKA